MTKKRKLEMDWLSLETRLRGALKRFAQSTCSEDRLRDTITEIDEIIACETRRGNELPPGSLSGERHEEIANRIWGVDQPRCEKCDTPTSTQNLRKYNGHFLCKGCYGDTCEEMHAIKACGVL